MFYISGVYIYIIMYIVHIHKLSLSFNPFVSSSQALKGPQQVFEMSYPCIIFRESQRHLIQTSVASCHSSAHVYHINTPLKLHMEPED